MLYVNMFPLQDECTSDGGILAMPKDREGYWQLKGYLQEAFDDNKYNFAEDNFCKLVECIIFKVTMFVLVRAPGVACICDKAIKLSSDYGPI
jgi:hypothetical protein